MRQKQHHSLLETIGSNILSAIIDIVFILIVAPILGIKLNVPQVSIAFTLLYAAHMIKGYFWRRFCDYLHHRKVLYGTRKKRSS